MIKIINRTKSFAAFVLLAGVYLIGCSVSGTSENENMVSKFIVHDASFAEGNANHLAEIRTSISGSLASDINVSFEVGEGTAIFGTDVMQSDGEIIFQPDVSEAIIPVEIIGDEHFELTETFELRLNYEGETTLFNISITDNDKMAEILTNSEGFYTPAEYPSMRLQWSDEFDAEELNTAYWTYEIGDGYDKGICSLGNEELETYSEDESNSRLEDGNLIITARKENGEYTSARIKKEDKVEVQFGRIDVRAKLPKGQGIWPAIWMLGANINQVGWPACGEIDIMELVGHQPEAGY